MKYINFNQEYEQELIELWNKCLYFDQINEAKFYKQAILDDNFDENLCWLAVSKDKPIGFVMCTKRKFPYLERGLEPDRGWINVLFVDPKYRNKGVGQHLYDLAENKLRSLGVKEITLAAYSPGYFFAGVDEEHYPMAACFFKKNGYQDLGQHYSMGRKLQEFDLSEEDKNKLNQIEEKGYQFKHFTKEYTLELLSFLKDEFGGGWKRNALLAMREGNAEELIVLCLDKYKKICGFSMSAIDGNPMRFGPIGIAKQKRNEGLGSLLLKVSLMEMKKRGICYMFFLTTNEQGKRYYERNGLEVIRICHEYRKKI